MATHSSILAWIMPWTEEPGGLQSIGLQRVRHDWNDWVRTHDHCKPMAVAHSHILCAGKPCRVQRYFTVIWRIYWYCIEVGNTWIYTFVVQPSLIQLKAYTWVHTQSLQACPTLCDPKNCCPPGSSVHGILQARILGWISMPSSKGSWRDRNHIFYISCTAAYSLLPSPRGSPLRPASVSWES